MNGFSRARGMVRLFAMAVSFTFPAAAASSAESAATGMEWDSRRLAELSEQIEAGTYPATTSVLVVHDGRLIHETYFGEGHAEFLNDTRSATKTITAMLVGAAVDRGLITGVDAGVYGFFPESAALTKGDEVRAAIDIEDLLTMSSMWECDDGNAFSAGNEERMYLSRSWTRFALELPIKGFAPWMRRPEDSPHGRAFSYCTAGPFLLGALIERVSGQSLQAFAAEVLEKPLGIDASHWNRSAEGVGSGVGGTRYRSRDLAKLGQLLLDEGRWQGRQILSSDWVRSMLSIHAQARDDAEYGYLIWRFRFSSDGKEVAAWAMSGNGGNYVFIVPERRLVTVITRQHYNQPRMHPQTHEMFVDYVLKAMPVTPREARRADSEE